MHCSEWQNPTARTRNQTRKRRPPRRRAWAPRDDATATLHVEDCVQTLRRLPAGECALWLADPPYEGVVSAQWDAVQGLHGLLPQMDWRGRARAAPRRALLIYGSPERNWIPRLAVMLEDEFGDRMQLVQHLSWVFSQGGGSRVSSMSKYAVQHEQLLWFERKGGGRVFNASEGVEHYLEEERAVALAKGKGRVSDASLDRGRPPRSFLDFARENSRSKERVLRPAPEHEAAGPVRAPGEAALESGRRGRRAVCRIGLRSCCRRPSSPAAPSARSSASTPS